jgi:hypothetical protein
MSVMRKTLVLALAAGGMVAGGSFISGSAWSAKAPKSCSEAYRACSGTSATVPKACDEQKKWCMSTGTFEDPKSKALHLNLLKK